MHEVILHHPIRRVQEILRSASATGLLITHLPHVQWVCGFTGSNGFLIVKEDGVHLVTDARYKTQAAQEVHHANVHIGKHDLIRYAVESGLVVSTDRLIIQPEFITHAEYGRWKTESSGLTLMAIDHVMEPHVAIKSEEAIAGMRRAQTVSDAVYEKVVPSIAVGMHENELAAQIDYYHRLRGASRMAFETIVAFGENTARPHARPGSRTLGPGEAILLDFGGVVDGYCSDMTRTLFCGVPGREFKDAYQSVLKAQAQAVAQAQAGKLARKIDQAARSSLAADGYEKFFAHSTGHGIGLEVHEWPRIATSSADTLEGGHTITIEPGVYIPDKFGIRIEDTVLIGARSCERLSCTDRTLISV